MRHFLSGNVPPLIMAFTGEDEAEVISRIQLGIALGAEGFCLQTCYMKQTNRNCHSFMHIMQAAHNLPVYVTNYRHASNIGIPDDELAQGLLMLAESGASLCDVMGDLFDPQPEEMTYNPDAVAKQKELVTSIHARGAQALISAHIYRFLPADEVLHIALQQKKRGADIVKIVTYAQTVEQENENLKTTTLLKQKMDVPFLFLSNGVSRRHRFEGPSYGSCLYLGCLDDTIEPKPSQPSIAELKAFRFSRYHK